MFPSGKIAPENSTFSEKAPVREHLDGGGRTWSRLGRVNGVPEREHTGQSLSSRRSRSPPQLCRRPPPRPPLGKRHGVGRLLERLVADRYFLEPRLFAPFLLLLAHTCPRPVVAAAGICQGVGHASRSIRVRAHLTPLTVSARLTRL